MIPVKEKHMIYSVLLAGFMANTAASHQGVMEIFNVS